MPLFLLPEYGCAVVIPSSTGECLVLFASKKGRFTQLALGTAGAVDRTGVSAVVSESPPYGEPAGDGARAELVPPIALLFHDLFNPASGSVPHHVAITGH